VRLHVDGRCGVCQIWGAARDCRVSSLNSDGHYVPSFFCVIAPAARRWLVFQIQSATPLQAAIPERCLTTRTGKGFSMADSVLPDPSPSVRPKKDNHAAKGRAVDLTGKTFGFLTVIERVSNEVRCSGKMRSVWNCICVCGTRKTAAAESLRSGSVKSCGCYKSGRSRLFSPSYHAMSGTAECRAWNSARNRTMNPNNRDYSKYGGRGITMCDAWIDDFVAFFNDMGPRPPGTSLDRIDNNGPYSKKNCRWATPAEQARNRRSTVLFRVGDEEKTLTEWSRVSGVPEPRIWKRINKLGWPVERAIFEPVLTTWSKRLTR
jgi:hypothetical protein